MIGLISSVPEEGTLFIRQLKKKALLAGRPVYAGRIRGKDAIYIISGLGKTNAAHAATILLEKFSPKILVLFGVGGAYPSAGLGIGDIAMAEREVYGDEGVMVKGGFCGTEFIGIPLLRRGKRSYFNEFPLDKALIRRAKNILVSRSRKGPKEKQGEFKIQSGTFVTLSTCTGTGKKASELERRFGALCENMEGASVAHICAIYDTPMIEIRGISNIVSDRDKDRWDIPLAAAHCQEAAMELLRNF
jgi:futalosine hydrolase